MLPAMLPGNMLLVAGNMTNMTMLPGNMLPGVNTA